MISIYDDDQKVGELTKKAIAESGSRLLQIHRFAADDNGHVDKLLEVFDPENGEWITDVGCGVGRLAELMKEQRNDLEFILINKSETQLEMCPTNMRKMVGIGEDLPLEADSVDAVLISYVIGHLGVQTFLQECDRVLTENGKIYVYDIFKQYEHCQCGLKDSGYTEWTMDEVIAIMLNQGFEFVRSETTAFAPDKIVKMMPYKNVLKNTISAAMVFEKCN